MEKWYLAQKFFKKGCFRKLCCYETRWLISAPGCSLSAGQAVSILGCACLGLTFPQNPQESRTLRYNQPGLTTGLPHITN
ncbi:hypothetical protein SAMN05443252_104366 [Bacillus sp. OV322]|uniref:hypothetical protein n=1 Tax=Bacillus sp. OV322 TaxID=1882764 RepID=UPI0008ECA4C5|nr:hypothetical protein [Bacillus sp. OV322]SFC56905.1 hypothetical protein SAMN05443252_104366 [Bacillus sp. OV322]